MKFEKILPENSKRRVIVKKIYDKYIAKNSTEERRYLKWIKQNEPNEEELENQRNHKFEIEPKISIIVPIYNTPEKFFEELVQSLENQTYSNWELCLADGSPEKLNYIEEYTKRDKRIKYKAIGENKGISGNTNEALSLATGDFVGLLDHDDLLPIFSLFEVVKAINENPEVEFLYSDEDKLEAVDKPRYGVFFKPDFSPYTLNSANYICHFSIFKKELIDKLKGFDSRYDGSQDWDIVARAIESTKNIVHIPKVLYHWRAHRNSTAQNSDSKPYAFEIGKKVITDHIKRTLDTEVEVTDGLTPGSYKIKYKVKDNPKVSIIIDAKDLTNEEIQKIVQKVKITTYTNYEIIVITDKNIESVDKIIKPKNNIFKTYNEAVKEIEGKYFIIIDKNLIKIDIPSYIEDLVGICQDKEVGIVGTKLYNKNNEVEHNGVVLGMNGVGDFLYKGLEKDAGTYMQRLSIIHNVSCVYYKYSMIDKKLFEECGGFPINYSGDLNSIEICLKILNQNKQVIMNPIVSFCVKKLSDTEHEEEQVNEFIKKWDKYYSIGDRYFSPNLSKKYTNIAIKVDD